MIKAKPDCCEEAAMGMSFGGYIPCNRPATVIVGWPKRPGEQNLRMCAMCADHNTHNRGAEIIGPYVCLAEQEIPE